MREKHVFRITAFNIFIKNNIVQCHGPRDGRCIYTCIRIMHVYKRGVLCTAVASADPRALNMIDAITST